MRDSAQIIPLHQTPFSGKSPRKPKNRDARPREYLTEDEVDRLMKAARSIGRHGFRDATLVLLAYRHGLRVSELVSGPDRPETGPICRRESKERRTLDFIPCVDPKSVL